MLFNKIRADTGSLLAFFARILKLQEHLSPSARPFVIVAMIVPPALLLGTVHDSFGAIIFSFGSVIYFIFLSGLCAVVEANKTGAKT